MFNKCYISKRKIIRVQFLYSNEDPVQEKTIGYPPQLEERELSTPQLP